MKLIALGVLLCMSTYAYADNWVLLVAGSNTYDNYRHQADVCHAYQIVHKYGIPDDHIVVMMYDDIANNEENPKKGHIFNKPDGPDVYKGTLKDYTKKHVTPENFLKVLQGKPTNVGSKKVINSGPNDNVFVFFSDHGAPGIVAFPDGSVLQATDLNDAIKSMHKNKQYKNMVFYVEACESGSMFEGLLADDINVYATTASNAEESSYACYYDDELQTYLGDLYSVNWMEDSDKGHIFQETLDQQFKIVRKLTNQSHVMEYGNLTMSTDFLVSQFQAKNNATAFESRRTSERNPNSDAVRSEDVTFNILLNKLRKEKDEAKRGILMAGLKREEQLKKLAVGVIRTIASLAVQNENVDLTKVTETKTKLINHQCYAPAVKRLLEKCFSAKNNFVLRNLYVLVNLCENGIKSEKIIEVIDTVCPRKFND